MLSRLAIASLILGLAFPAHAGIFERLELARQAANERKDPGSPFASVEAYLEHLLSILPPLPDEGTVRDMTWATLSGPERVAYWNTLTMPEQRLYHWGLLVPEARIAFCGELGLSADCVPLP